MGKHSKPEDERRNRKKRNKKDKNKKEVNKNDNKKDLKKVNSNNSTNRKTKKKKHKVLRRVLLIILGLLIIAGVAFGVVVYKNGGGMKGIVTTFIGSDVETVKNLEDIYVLCMGASQNMTDTIMVVKYSPQNQQASILSIPRDSFVGKSKDSATAFDKINAKYQLNPQATVDAVNSLTGLNIKYFVTVDTKALRELVDAIGGVEFDVPIDMDYDDPTQDLEIHVKQGKQVLDGKNAEGVVRFRHNNDFSTYSEEYGDNDLGRMRTQREFITTVLKQTLKATNVTKIGEIINIAKERVVTNIEWDLIKNYIVALMDFDTENLQTDSLPGTPQYINQISFFLVDKTAAKEKVNEMFLSTPQTKDESEEDEGEETNKTNTTKTSTSKSTTKSSSTDKSSITLEVLNGTGSNTKFNSAIEQLKAQGYKVNKKGTTNVTAKTLIIDRRNNSKESENELKSLLCTGVITTGEDNNDVDFTVIIGTDY